MPVPVTRVRKVFTRKVAETAPGNGACILLAYVSGFRI